MFNTPTTPATLTPSPLVTATRQEYLVRVRQDQMFVIDAITQSVSVEFAPAFLDRMIDTLRFASRRRKQAEFKQKETMLVIPYRDIPLIIRWLNMADTTRRAALKMGVIRAKKA